jgi:transcriptional regulator with XRE-family HTH domain
MKNPLWAQLLSEIDQFSRSRGLTRKNMAEMLGVPYGTYKNWFQKTKRLPSSPYIQKLENFLNYRKNTEGYLKELWRGILIWWETQHQYPTIENFADSVGWEPTALTNHFASKEPPPKLVIEKMANMIGLKAPVFAFSEQETQRKAEKIKYLLIFLEEELRWFRDGSDQSRNIFRNELDLDDIGYVTSLLTMLGDEGRFKRWLALTTNRFNFFRKKGRKNEKNPHQVAYGKRS